MVVVGFGFVSALVACAMGEAAPDEGEDPGAVTPDGGGTAPDGAPKPPPGPCVPGQCPPNTWNLDGKTDGENCGCEYSCTKRSDEDELDPAFEDTNCDGSDGVVATCVYVSVSKGDDAGDGTRLKPLKTLARAVLVAGSGTKKRPVCVSAEKYAESVDLPSGVSLYGGFDQADAAFPFRRSRKHGTTDIATTIVAPTTGPLAGDGVLIRELREDMHVENLTLEVKIPEAQDGKSVYGVRVMSSSGGRLFVRKNVFLLGNGNQGERGTTDVGPPTSPAASGNTGAAGCSSCSSAQPGAAAPTCTAPGGRGGNGGLGSDSSGAAGATGAGGAAGGGGGSGSACISSGGGNVGLAGASAGTGAAPAAGGAGGEAVGTIVNGLYVSSPGKRGLPGGNGGGGGGGGGGGASARTWPICISDGGGGGGSGGCGGAGGAPGTGGGAGGSSIGVLVGSGAATVENNVFTLGNGGTGGAGGLGGVGQPGGGGGSGGAGASSAAGGGRGGSGGVGGPGSGGGGGSGGHSAYVARASTATLVESGNTGALGAPGPAGAGGSGGSGAPTGKNGADGIAREVLVAGP
jgi:hypothetical protein